MLKKIYQELVDIKKNLKVLEKSMKSKNESHHTHDFNYASVKKAVLNTLNQQPKLTPASVARRIQTDCQEGKIKDKEELVELTTWENILMTRQNVEPPIMREIGVVGIDYTKMNDIAAAGVLTKRGAKFIFKQHTWICANSADLPCIKFPYTEAVEAGDAEIIDAPEIPPELIADWVATQATLYNIPMLAIDDYRYALMKVALEHVGFSYENENIKLVRQSDRIKIEPIIDSGFSNHNIVYGDCPIMRWYTNNTKKVKSKKYGNYEYRGIEVKSRKTVGFFAFVAAMTQHELIPEQQTGGEIGVFEKAKEFAMKIMDKPNPSAQEIATLPQILEILLNNKTCR